MADAEIVADQGPRPEKIVMENVIVGATSMQDNGDDEMSIDESVDAKDTIDLLSTQAFWQFYGAILVNTCTARLANHAWDPVEDAAIRAASRPPKQPPLPLLRPVLAGPISTHWRLDTVPEEDLVVVTDPLSDDLRWKPPPVIRPPFQRVQTVSLSDTLRGQGKILPNRSLGNWRGRLQVERSTLVPVSSARYPPVDVVSAPLWYFAVGLAAAALQHGLGGGIPASSNDTSQPGPVADAVAAKRQDAAKRGPRVSFAGKTTVESVENNRGIFKRRSLAAPATLGSNKFGSIFKRRRISDNASYEQQGINNAQVQAAAGWQITSQSNQGFAGRELESAEEVRDSQLDKPPTDQPLPGRNEGATAEDQLRLGKRDRKREKKDRKARKKEKKDKKKRKREREAHRRAVESSERHDPITKKKPRKGEAAPDESMETDVAISPTSSQMRHVLGAPSRRLFMAKSNDTFQRARESLTAAKARHAFNSNPKLPRCTVVESTSTSLPSTSNHEDPPIKATRAPPVYSKAPSNRLASASFQHTTHPSRAPQAQQESVPPSQAALQLTMPPTADRRTASGPSSRVEKRASLQARSEPQSDKDQRAPLDKENRMLLEQPTLQQAPPMPPESHFARQHLINSQGLQPSWQAHGIPEKATPSLQNNEAVQVLCSEGFIELWGDLVAELGSGRWMALDGNPDQNPDIIGAYSQSPHGHSIELVDTPILNNSSVDIELPNRCAVILYTSSSLVREADARDVLASLAKLVSAGGYKRIFVFICIDTEISECILHHIVQIEGATLCSGLEVEPTLVIKTAISATLSASIAATVFWGMRQSQILDESEKELIQAAKTWQCVIRAKFLLELVPTLTGRGAIQCLLAAKALTSPCNQSFLILMQSEALRREIMVQASKEPSKLPDIHPKALPQLQEATTATLGRYNAVRR